MQGLTTILQTDSAAAPTVRAVLNNVDDLVSTEYRARLEARFTADTLALKRLGFHALPGLNIEIFSGREWFAINATFRVSLPLRALGSLMPPLMD